MTTNTNHPITEALQPLDPPLAPEEAIEAYIGVSDARRLPPSRHAFGVILHFSSGREPIEITHQSRSRHTHAQRANLGAVLTVLEWLKLNGAQTNPVTVFVADEWLTNLRQTLRSKRKTMLDLYVKIEPLLDGLPQVRFKWVKRAPEAIHHERYERAHDLARETLQQLFDPIPNAVSKQPVVDPGAPLPDDWEFKISSNIPPPTRGQLKRRRRNLSPPF